MKFVQLHGTVRLSVVARDDYRNPSGSPNEETIKWLNDKYQVPWFLFWHIDPRLGIPFVKKYWEHSPEHTGPVGVLFFRGGYPLAGLKTRDELAPLLCDLGANSFRINVLDDAVSGDTADLNDRLERFAERLSSSPERLPWETLKAPLWPARTAAIAIANHLICQGIWTDVDAKKHLEPAGSEINVSDSEAICDNAPHPFHRSYGVYSNQSETPAWFTCNLCKTYRWPILHEIKDHIQANTPHEPRTQEQWQLILEQWGKKDLISNIAMISQQDRVQEIHNNDTELIFGQVPLRGCEKNELACVRDVIQKAKQNFCALCRDPKAAVSAAQTLTTCVAGIFMACEAHADDEYDQYLEKAFELLRSFEADSRGCKVPL